MSVDAQGYTVMKKMSANPNLEAIASKPAMRTDPEVEHRGFRVVDLGDDMFDDDSWNDFPAQTPHMPSVDPDVINRLLEDEIKKLDAEAEANAETRYIQRPVIDSPDSFTINNKAPVPEIDAKVQEYLQMRNIPGYNLVNIEPISDDEQGGMSRSYTATWAKRDKAGKIEETRFFVKALLLANDDTKHEGQRQRAIARAVDAPRKRMQTLAKDIAEDKEYLLSLARMRRDNRTLETDELTRASNDEKFSELIEQQLEQSRPKVRELSDIKKRLPKIQSESPVPYTYGTHIDRTSDGSYLPIIVMDFVEGKPFYKELADPAVPHLRKLHLVERLARALGEIHATGNVHLDVKGENAIVTKNDNIKIIDYSLAAKVGEEAKSKDIVGTRLRMSPEHFDRLRDPRADVYSVGLMLYNALIGEEAFASLEKFLGPDGNATQEYCDRLYAAMVNNDHFKNASPRVITALHGLTDTLAGILYNATAGKIEDRYKDCFALANALKSAEEEYARKTYQMLEPGLLAVNEERRRKNTPQQMESPQSKGPSRFAKAMSSLYYKMTGQAEAKRQEEDARRQKEAADNDIVAALMRAAGQTPPEISEVTEEIYSKLRHDVP